MAGNFLMENSFSPRWANPRPRRYSVPRSDDGHHGVGLETLSRFLHAFNLHHSNESNGHAREGIKVHPHFDLVETSEDYKIYGELPGLGSQDIHVDVNNHLFTATVSGEFTVPMDIVALQAKDEAVAVTQHTEASEKGKAEAEEKGKEVAAEEPKKEQAAGEDAAAAGPATTGEAESGDKAKDETKAEEAKPKIQYHIQERSLGRFKREFRFPVESVVMDDIKAQCRNGLLTLTVPKHATPATERKKGRKLDVE